MPENQFEKNNQELNKSNKTQEEIKEYLDYLKKLQFIRPGTRNL